MRIKRFEFNMFPVNCYILSDETKEAVIIDAGCFYEEEKQALKKYIDDNGLNVKHLLNTHLHLDHIFGNPFLLKEYGLKAEANQADEFWLNQADAQARMFGFQLPEPPVPLGKYVCDGSRGAVIKAFLSLDSGFARENTYNSPGERGKRI